MRWSRWHLSAFSTHPRNSRNMRLGQGGETEEQRASRDIPLAGERKAAELLRSKALSLAVPIQLTSLSTVLPTGCLLCLLTFPGPLRVMGHEGVGWGWIDWHSL